MAGMFGSQYNDTKVMIDDLANLSQMNTQAAKADSEGVMKPPKGEEMDAGSWWAWLSGYTRQKTEENIKKVQEELASMGVDTAGLSPEYQQSMLEGIQQAQSYRDKWGITQSSNAGPVWLEEQGDFPVINEPSSITVTPLDDTTGPMTDMAGLMAPPKSGEAPKAPSPMSKPDTGESEELETSKAEEAPSIDTTEAAAPISDVEWGSEAKLGNLTLNMGTRADYKPTADKMNISLDFNSFKGAKGTEVIIPDSASDEVRAAAENFNNLVVEFAAKHGYSNYKNRGVKTRSQNKRGVRNTIHVEPFFTQDAKMEQIISENMDEFAGLYKDAFSGLSARMVAPHGVTNKKGVQDRGAVSKTFGDELSFGESILKRLFSSLGT